MAHLFSEGWDVYGAITDVIGCGKYRWVTTPAGSNPGFGLTAGKFGGRALLSLTAGYAATIRCDMPKPIPSGSTFYVAGWWKLAFGGGKTTASPYALVGVNGFNIISYDGQYLTLRNGQVTAPVATGTTFLADGYHWIEVSIQLAGANSKVTAYVDGIQQFSGTYNLGNLPAQDIPVVYIGTDYGVANGLNALDDFIIWDSTGADFNTFPMGPRRIGLMNPAGPGDMTQFVSSTGAANWQVASQAFGNTPILADGGTGLYDLYTYSALPYVPKTTVNAVVVNTQAQNPAADAQHSVMSRIKSGGVLASGTPKVLVATNTINTDVFTRDPSGNPWTLASLNASQIGFGD
ncbi:hypothetical protein [Burkholderia phage BCSR5]|nr:hypothetical protein [Burkholderia phage BCSR5]